MSTREKQIRGTLCTLAGAACWGFSGTCGQYIFANSDIDSGTLTAFRMLGSGVLLCLFCLVRQGGKMFAVWKSIYDTIRMVLFAIFGLMFSQFAYLTAIQYSNSGTATVLQYTGIILIVVVSCIFGRRFPKRKEVIAMILAIVGVFLLATHGKLNGIVLSKEALEWGLIAAFALMLYTLLPGRLLEEWGTLVITGFAMFIGGIILAFMFRIWNFSGTLSFQVWLAFAAIIVIGTLVAFSLYLQGVLDLGPVKASMIACVEPVVATVISAFWLGTKFQGMDLVGFVCIIGGVLVVSWPSGKSYAGTKKKTGNDLEFIK